MMHDALILGAVIYVQRIHQLCTLTESMLMATTGKHTPVLLGES